MATSTIPAMKKALLLQLKARTNLAAGPNGQPVQVSYGYPAPLPEVEYIWLGDAKGDQTPATIGTRARDERYVLTIVIYTQNSDPADQETPTERAFALMSEIEQQLRTDPTVNGTVLTGQVGGPLELIELAGSETRGALLTLGVTCRARI
jgi:hypothetical protein